MGSLTIRVTPCGQTRVFSGRRSMTPVGPKHRLVKTSSARSSLLDTATNGPGWSTAAGASSRRVFPVRVGALIAKCGGAPEITRSA